MLQLVDLDLELQAKRDLKRRQQWQWELTRLDQRLTRQEYCYKIDHPFPQDPILLASQLAANDDDLPLETSHLQQIEQRMQHRQQILDSRRNEMVEQGKTLFGSTLCYILCCRLDWTRSEDETVASDDDSDMDDDFSDMELTA